MPKLIINCENKDILTYIKQSLDDAVEFDAMDYVASDNYSDSSDTIEYDVVTKRTDLYNTTDDEEHRHDWERANGFRR